MTHEPITNIKQWAEKVMADVKDVSKTVAPELPIDKIDSRLVRMWEAKRSLQARWQKERHNRKLRKRIALFNKQIEEHCRTLSKQQWDEIFNTMGGRIGTGHTWRMLRQLLDPTKTTTAHRETMRRIIHTHTKDEEEILSELCDRYAPQNPVIPHVEYSGKQPFSGQRLRRGVNRGRSAKAQWQIGPRTGRRNQ